MQEDAKLASCGYPQGKQDIFQVYFIVFATFSCVYFVICFLIIYSRIKYPEIMTYEFKMIYYLAIADFFFTAQIFVTPSLDHIIHESPNCKVQAFLSNATTYSSTIWTFIIILILYKTTVKRTQRSKLFTRRCEFTALFFGYIVPLVLSVLPFIFDVYGNSGFWCWVRLPCIKQPGSWEGASKFFMLLQYVIFWGITTASLYLFCNVWTWMEKYALQDEKRFIQVLSLFPLFLFIYVFTASVDRIYNFLTNDKFFTAMSIFHVTVSYIQKLFVSAIFGLNPTVRKRICEDFCCRRRIDRHHTLSQQVLESPPLSQST